MTPWQWHSKQFLPPAQLVLWPGFREFDPGKSYQGHIHDWCDLTYSMKKWNEIYVAKCPKWLFSTRAAKRNANQTVSADKKLEKTCLMSKRPTSSKTAKRKTLIVENCNHYIMGAQANSDSSWIRFVAWSGKQNQVTSPTNSWNLHEHAYWIESNHQNSFCHDIPWCLWCLKPVLTQELHPWKLTWE